MRSIAINKKANFNYIITEKIEAGIVLTGSEVKSLRNNSVSIKESYIAEKNSEIWLFNCHISNYNKSIDSDQNPIRERKILLSKKEKNRKHRESYHHRQKFLGFAALMLQIINIPWGEKLT